MVVCRAIGVSAREYIQLVWLRPFAAGVLVFAGVEVLRQFLPIADTWSVLFLSGACAVALSTVVIIAIGLDRSEKRRFLAEPLARFHLLLSQNDLESPKK